MSMNTLFACTFFSRFLIATSKTCTEGSSDSCAASDEPDVDADEMNLMQANVQMQKHRLEKQEKKTSQDPHEFAHNQGLHGSVHEDAITASTISRAPVTVPGERFGGVHSRWVQAVGGHPTMNASRPRAALVTWFVDEFSWDSASIITSGIIMSVFVLLCILWLNGCIDQRVLFLMHAVVYFVSTVGMNLVNKVALNYVAPFMLVALQMIVAVILLTLFTLGSVWKPVYEKAESAGRWILVALPFIGMLATSMLALSAGSVTLLLVGRNFLPLFISILERALLPHTAGPMNAEIVASLIMIFVGTIIYVLPNFTTVGPAMAMIVVNMVLTCVHRLLEKRLLADEKFVLDFKSATLLNNLLGIPPMLALAKLDEEHFDFHELLGHWDQSLVILASCVFGVSLGYYSIVLQKALSATSFVVMQTSGKLVTVALAMLVLQEGFTLVTGIGCALSLAATAWYAIAVSRARNQK